MDLSLSKLQELVMDRKTRHATVHRVTESQTWLSDWTELHFLLYFFSLVILIFYSQEYLMVLIILSIS